MFRRLFGFKDSQSPAPPKNQIEVVCPACGAAQFEPRLAVSTFCKRCGVHLKLEKKRVIASEVTRAGGKPEALAPTQRTRDFSAPESAPDSLPLPETTTAPERRPLASLTTPMQRMAVPDAVPNVDVSETGELGLGMMMQATAKPEPVASSKPPTENIPLTDGERPTPIGTGALSARVEHVGEVSIEDIMRPQINVAANPATLQKMRDAGFYRNHNFKDAQCFECDTHFKVNRSARSAHCTNCGAFIPLEDVELNMPSNHAVKTRGDVLIRKRGHLTAEHLYARDLRCFGIVEANIRCTGDATFKTVGTILGEVRCRKFLVEKGAEVEFLNDVRAEEIDIQGKAKGHFFSEGPLTIAATASVDGSVTGRSINIEPGGELNGSMNIVRSTKA